MIQRIALLAGGLGAAAVLALALGAGNLITFGAGGEEAAAAVADSQPAVADVAPVDTPNAVAQDQSVQPAQTITRTKTVIDKIYVAPTSTPRANHHTNTTPTAPPAPTQTSRPNPPAGAAPRSHDDQESERETGHHGEGHERGDD